MSEDRPIIIKKKKSGGGDGHHGGAWKVAYADFVTAMMAFFLLMWLLNATSEDQRKGLADFFDPQIPISRNSAGGAGMLNGDQVFAKPEASGSQVEGVRPKPTNKERGEDLGDNERSSDDPDGETGGAPKLAEQGQAELEAQAQMDDVAQDLVGQIQALGEDGLLQHFSMRMTPEGLVIEIGDLQGEPLFGPGQVQPESILTTLVDILVPVLDRTSNDIAITGHTDATPFSGRRDYTNWELSADRANAARRLMSERGFDEGRIARVSGRAATDPLDADPAAPRNRRIAIILLRDDQS